MISRMSTQSINPSFLQYLNADLWKNMPTIPQPQYFTFNIPVEIKATINMAVEITHISATLQRHDELLQEMYEMIRVIEIETRRLNPNPIDDLADAAESELNDILQMVKNKNLPSVNTAEAAILGKALERKRQTAGPAIRQE
jgi:uncharacterized protein YfkK (UPF0435 family)